MSVVRREFDTHGPRSRIPRRRSLADLIDHNCLLYAYSTSGPEYDFIDPAGNAVAVRVSGNLFTTSIAAMRTADSAGVGLRMGPPFIVSDLLASGALVPLLADYGRPEMEIVALYPHRRHLLMTPTAKPGMPRKPERKWPPPKTTRANILCKQRRQARTIDH
jgi:DNA-binding transcriptional LysR family regulator